MGGVTIEIKDIVVPPHFKNFRNIYIMNAPEYSHSEEFVSGMVIAGPQLFRQDLWFCCYEKVIYTWKSLIKLF